MDVRVSPSALSGIVSAIPSKSDAHRVLILSALADRPTTLTLSDTNDDIEATLACLEALGACVVREHGSLTIYPIDTPVAKPVLNCRESGSTLRFMLPVAASLASTVAFSGTGRLPKRPIDELRQAMEDNGVCFSQKRLPFETIGKLTPGEYTLPGDISSQYVSGLLLALFHLKGESKIVLSSPLESRPYVDITLSALSRFGISVVGTENGWMVPGHQQATSSDVVFVEGDWSNAAFFLSAGALGSTITVSGLDEDTAQGDKNIVWLLNEFGASVYRKEAGITVSPGLLDGFDIDVSEIPDLVPVLSVVAACAKGTTRFLNAGRLRFKESDRLSTTAAMLTQLGIKVEEGSDSLTVHGGLFKGGRVDGAGDHRIVMAAAIAATVADGPVVITGAQAVNKSYPTFFEHVRDMGGKVDVL